MSPEALAVAERDRDAYRLHAEGHTYDQIAHDLGFANRSSAHKAVQRATRRFDPRPSAAARRLEYLRLQEITYMLSHRIFGPGWLDQLLHDTGLPPYRDPPAGWKTAISLQFRVNALLTRLTANFTVDIHWGNPALPDDYYTRPRPILDPELLAGRALALRARGHSFTEIATHLGLRDKAAARRRVAREHKARDAATLHDHRARLAQHLDDLQTELWPHAQTGNLRAIGTLVRIIDQRCKLLHLYPPRHAYHNTACRPLPAALLH